jgi:hypothetical protein
MPSPYSLCQPGSVSTIAAVAEPPRIAQQATEPAIGVGLRRDGDLIGYAQARQSAKWLHGRF